MTSRNSATITIVTLAVVASAFQLAPAPAFAQDVILSPVPKDDCCFTNFRFAGTCRVLPRQGQYCENILSYLNNFNSTGESYCSTTFIRGGWTLINCASGGSAGPIGHTNKQYIDTHQTPDRATVTSPTEADLLTPKQRAPGPVELGELSTTDASVIQVRLEQALDGDQLDAGQSLTGRLESDLLGPDGEVLAPAGSTISATVGAENTWDSAAGGSLKLQLVGTTTGAADLFGTLEDDTTPESAQEPSVHLTGDLVELGSDSVLTFQVQDVSDQPADMRVLATATSVWMEAFNGRDAVTIAGLWSEDGALLPPNGRAIIGRQAIFAYWKGLLEASTNQLELVNIETVVEGDLGYKAGRFELLDQSTGKTVDQGKYMQIWKRTSRGYWELHRDMWNSNK